jgi:hypothetical protein
MDRGVKNFGPKHRELDKYHGIGAKEKASGLIIVIHGKKFLTMHTD